MSQKAILGIVIAVVVILGAYLFFQRGPVAEAPETETEEETMDDEASENGDSDVDEDGDEEDSDEDEDTGDTGGDGDVDAVVTYTDSGFSPATVEVSVGETVLFRNESSQSFWPASAIHPTHQLYPGSDIALCGTAEAAGIFDACGSISSGGTYSFTFNEAGEWKYHNHLRATQTGTIVVE